MVKTGSELQTGVSPHLEAQLGQSFSNSSETSNVSPLPEAEFDSEALNMKKMIKWFRATQLGWIRWCPHAVGGGVGVGGGNCWGAGTRNEFRSVYSGSGRGSDGWNNNRGD
ncbi:hypothetical protein Tco_0235984 [Tanacetum coccineum]